MWFLFEVKRWDLRIEGQVHFGWTLFLIVLLQVPFVLTLLGFIVWDVLKWWVR